MISGLRTDLEPTAAIVQRPILLIRGRERQMQGKMMSGRIGDIEYEYSSLIHGINVVWEIHLGAGNAKNFEIFVALINFAKLF